MLQAGLRWMLGALLLMGLSGCGQMGPLYMPEEEPVKTSPPSGESTPAPTSGNEVLRK